MLQDVFYTYLGIKVHTTIYNTILSPHIWNWNQYSCYDLPCPVSKYWWNVWQIFLSSCSIGPQRGIGWLCYRLMLVKLWLWTNHLKIILYWAGKGTLEKLHVHHDVIRNCVITCASLTLLETLIDSYLSFCGIWLCSLRNL